MGLCKGAMLLVLETVSRPRPHPWLAVTNSLTSLISLWNSVLIPEWWMTLLLLFMQCVSLKEVSMLAHRSVVCSEGWKWTAKTWRTVALKRHDHDMLKTAQAFLEVRAYGNSVCSSALEWDTSKVYIYGQRSWARMTAPYLLYWNVFWAIMKGLSNNFHQRTSCRYNFRSVKILFTLWLLIVNM